MSRLPSGDDSTMNMSDTLRGVLSEILVLSIHFSFSSHLCDKVKADPTHAQNSKGFAKRKKSLQATSKSINETNSI